MSLGRVSDQRHTHLTRLSRVTVGIFRASTMTLLRYHERNKKERVSESFLLPPPPSKCTYPLTPPLDSWRSGEQRALMFPYCSLILCPWAAWCDEIKKRKEGPFWVQSVLLMWPNQLITQRLLFIYIQAHIHVYSISWTVGLNTRVQRKLYTGIRFVDFFFLKRENNSK